MFVLRSLCMMQACHFASYAVMQRASFEFFCGAVARQMVVLHCSHHRLRCAALRTHGIASHTLLVAMQTILYFELLCASSAGVYNMATWNMVRSL